MSKEELKQQYKLKKISAKEYFLALGKILQAESPRDVTPVFPVKSFDVTDIFDGKLPLFSK